MNRETFIFFLGVLLVVLPFFGIPNAWKHGISVAFGLILILLGYQLRRHAYLRSIESRTGERRTDAYVEQAPQETILHTVPVEHTAISSMTVEDGMVAPKARRTRMKL
ncbi:hypothetical protein HY416_00825 [Candidatus Kaiserbacteria bacterium]|nr:hypothetical protein [Candidatus Kaiserbacteria bacterium]